MTQLSPERVGRITGSRVAAILGLSPYKDRDSVLREMVRERLDAPTEWVGNVATDWGNEHEPEATAAYEAYRGVMVHADQRFAIHPTLDYLGVTPDGLVGDHGMVQIKCPYRAGYSSIGDRPDYYAQIQLELECTDREWSDFFIWRPSGIACDRVGRDPGWLLQYQPVLDAFIAEFEDAVFDEDRHKFFLDPIDDGTYRDDFDWQLAALEYLEAKAAEDRAKATKEQARLKLIDLSSEQDSRGAGVSVKWADVEPSSYTVNRKGGRRPTVRVAS